VGEEDRMTRAASWSLLSVILVVACACATPVGVTHVDTQSMYRTLTVNVLSADRPSPQGQDDGVVKYELARASNAINSRSTPTGARR
jgi:hypothetical protein